MIRGRSFASCLAILLGGCAGIAEQSDRPAIFVDASAASHLELQAAVSRALGVTDITLAPDALTMTSLLTIERTPTRDAQGRPLNGRELGRPEQFSLVTSGERCVLIHAGSRMRIPLAAVRCQAIP